MRTLVSRSKVYGLLRRLYHMDWVHRHYDQKDHALHSVVAIDWEECLFSMIMMIQLLKKKRPT
jgi:hypothetical protein